MGCNPKTPYPSRMEHVNLRRSFVNLSVMKVGHIYTATIANPAGGSQQQMHLSNT
jgi:hypothetical protein